MSKDKMEQRPEPEKKCDCGPDCDCGCNEGKECTCGHHHGGPHGECGCGCRGGECKCGCGCGKRCGGKLIALLIVFLAGMGFNELWHGCFRCPSKAPHGVPAMHVPMTHHAVPAMADGAGTVIIINAADGSASMQNHSGKKHKCHCGKHHGENVKMHEGHKHHKDHLDFKKHQFTAGPSRGLPMGKVHSDTAAPKTEASAGNKAE